MQRLATCLFTLFLYFLLFASCTSYDLQVHTLFSDHVVLQQNDVVSVWGEAGSGKDVLVETTWGEPQSTTADAHGQWRLEIATGPWDTLVHTIRISSGGQEQQIQDVLLGEVWLCSGQSNMQMPLRGWPPNDPIRDAEPEISLAQFPHIRMFTVERQISESASSHCMGSWQVCSPATAGDFSAVGYFFGRTLNRQLRVPIGLIHASWGGTPAEAWTRETEGKNLSFFGDYYAARSSDENPPPPQHAASVLYNGMIAPLIPYRIKGAIWYQGESNVGRAEQYAELFPTMIESWRNGWGQGDFSFYFVQIAPF